MKIKRAAFIVCIILVAMMLAACERSLGSSSKKPKTEAPPAASTEAAPQATSDVMGQLELFVTQTAMAQTGVKPAQPTNATPAAPAAQATPASGGPTQPASPAQPTAAAAQPAAPAAPTAVPAEVKPAVVVPTATPGLPATYTVQKGEHPFCIARRFNINPQELLNVNNLGSKTIVYPGYLLKIPKTSNAFVGQRKLIDHPASHSVAAGESIYSIACAYGDVDPMAIAFANNLQAPYTLTPGQTLQIP